MIVQSIHSVILFSGLEAELYYVREGVVNTYAMNFVVPVPANIADLEFSWQSLVGHPVRIYIEMKTFQALKFTNYNFIVDFVYLSCFPYLLEAKRQKASGSFNIYVV